MTIQRKTGRRNPRILIVTPEITYLPAGMGNLAQSANAKAGGLADVSASLVASLFEQGADVHVALPHYRRMFHMDVGRLISNELRVYKNSLSDSRIHLAEDRCFYYRDAVYSNYDEENPRLALVFQREIINHIIPRVNPDLIHCNDWMTGLIPAASRRLGIPCLFTVHNIHTHELSLASIEDSGIDAAEFWKNLYFQRIPINYEETRDNNLVDLQASGVFASHFINTVSPTFLQEIVRGEHSFIPRNLQQEISNKARAGCASGILNAPDFSYNPTTDETLTVRYTPEEARAAKPANKLALQQKVGLSQDPNAPLFFWPSRLDPVQKGPELLTNILYHVLSRYHHENMQVVLVANGDYQRHFYDILHQHGLYGRLSVCDFDERLARQAYAASDFVLMPSRFEPCGLTQMIGAIYGALPVAHDTGGLHDTVEHIDLARSRGNGFIFRNYNSAGLLWAIDEAVRFWKLPEETRSAQVERVMRESIARFNHKVSAQNYIDIYERMLERDLIKTF